MGIADLLRNANPEKGRAILGADEPESTGPVAGDPLHGLRTRA